MAPLIDKKKFTDTLQSWGAGIVRIADTANLAAVSVPYEMTGHEKEHRRVLGHQRELNEKKDAGAAIDGGDL